MLHRARSLVTVLALAAPGMAFADKGADAFYHQTKYTYCDAKMLAGLWKQSMADTKARIGRKIDAGGASLKYLDGEIGHAKDHARKDHASRCDFNDIGLTFDDIQRVATVWKQSPGEIKSLVESKILDVGEASARELINNVAGQTTREERREGHHDDNDREIKAYTNQDRYQYCDARLIGDLWTQTVVEGKVYIGAKLLAKETQLLETKLAAARANAVKHNAGCTFGETGFEYADADKLAKMWKVDVSRSKAMIAQKVTDGHRADVAAALKRAR